MHCTKLVAFVGLKERQPQDGAVGGDQRQEDAQRPKQRRAHLLDEHLHQLHRGGDDGDEGDQLQVGRVDGDQQRLMPKAQIELTSITNITAPPMRVAVASLADTPRKGQIPRK